MNPDQQFGIIMTFMILTIVPLVLVFGIPVAKSFARRLERGSQPEDHSAELEELRHRVAELEERVDFNERLLAQVQQQDQLKG
ncbi:MAG TPA: hypothetical protein VJN95_11715 [Gemmatimonadales bacterium]|nr:hypothetical protein [Gemmatimonadales bacterium]